MSADWDEIKRLAADLQRAQLLSTSQRLSERNCVEIVTKLIELGLLDVVHTHTGKEYVTPEQISREIRDELLVSGGRMGLPELATALNVDFSHVEARAQRLAAEDRSTFLVNGYLVNSDYLDGVAEEVNEKLQQSGEIAIGLLATQYDLPAEFLQQELLRRTGSIILGQPDPEDPRLLFTEAFVAQNAARVRGALSAVTRPVTVQQLLQRHGIREQLFFNVAGELIGSGRVKGSLTGGRTAVRAVYVPECYTAAQNAAVDQQFRQNGCAEYESLRRLGISDPEQFVKKRFRDQNVRFLATCAVGESLVEQVQVSLEEATLSGGYVDVLPLLPSSATAEDAALLLEGCLGHALAETVMVSEKLMDQLRNPLQQLMPERARKDIASGRYPPKKATTSVRRADPEEGKRDKKDDRRKKAAGGKAGGGTQGRETRTKSTKKKYMQKGRTSDSEDEAPRGGRGGEEDEESAGPVFMTAAELEERLAAHPALHDAPDGLVADIATFLCRPLTQQYRELLGTQYQAALAAAGQVRRGNLAQFQDKVTGLALNVRLFQKGAAEFPSEARQQLGKHLLRTLCTELTNELFCRAAADADLQFPDSGQLSPEARVKILNQLPSDMAPDLQKLHKALTAADTGDFDAALDSTLAVCGVVSKKPDRKKDRQQQRAHLQCLLEQLNAATDAALTLHLAALVLFQTFTGQMLHASGKFVPAIVTRLSDLVTPEVLTLLQQCQALVVRQLKLKSSDPELADVRRELEQLLPQLKVTAASARRPSISAE